MNAIGSKVLTHLVPKLDGEASVGNNPGSGVTTDDEDDTSPPLALASRAEKIMDEFIEVSTALRESIRSGGIPENAQ